MIHLEPIQRDNRQPIYRQIVEQIRLQISDGRLPTGTQLPTVRQLAQMLSVTRLTIQNAYRELQAGGWVESTVGRGTFVAASTQNEAVVRAIGRHTTPERVMNDMDRISRLSGLRSLAYAEPDPALFPIPDFMSFFDSPIAASSALMQYGAIQGDEPLRVELVPLLNEQGIPVAPDDILILSGVSQGLSLAARALAKAGDCVAVEQPGYLGLLHILNANGLVPVGVPVDSEGVQLDALEQAIIGHNPRFLYTVPNFQNPTGACMSVARRQGLMALAERYQLPIVEDDIYGPLAYDYEPLLPLKSMDPDGLVIYLNGFSKTLMPGLRIGYLIANPTLLERLMFLRQASDITGPPLLQRALANFLHRKRMKAHLRHVMPHYRTRRDELLRALQATMPSYVRWTEPSGGFCCWVSLPLEKTPPQLHLNALRHGFAFTPGDAFYIAPDNEYHMRLCFGGLAPELIREAVTLLGYLLRTSMVPSVARLQGQELPFV